MTPDVSVVISTYNRMAQLPGAVEASLSQVAGGAYEIIVVDNNSTDGTREWVQQRCATAAGRLHYVHEPQQGLPFARNAGLAHARAPIIAFTDDDVRVAPGWVNGIRRAFARHPEIDLVGGRVLPKWPETVPGWFSRLQWAPLALQDKGDQPVRIGPENAAPCLIGASFAFRRSVFDRIGPFDVTYTRAQDREIQMRLWRAGGLGLYDPSIVAWVDVPEDRLTKQYFRFWYTRSGGFASRMRLLDQLDNDGRLVDPDANGGRRLLGCPAHVYRAALGHAAGWLRSALRGDEAAAFYHENRVRYHVAYIRTRIGDWRVGHAPAAPPAPHSLSREVS